MTQELDASRQLVRMLVHRGLVSESEAAAFLDDLEAKAAAGETTLPAVDELLASRGGNLKRFGPYVIQAELGRGASAVVYRAHHVSLDRPVALKVLLETTNAGLAERFRREAVAEARLRHPNVVGVHDAGTVDGRPYIAMELVEGRTLAEVLATRQMTLRQKVELVAKAADGLAHAHTHGIVHRDVKPTNIIVDTHGEPRIADFGLAHLAGAGTLTRAGVAIGTPMYMSPEHVRGEGVAERSDVWGLGVTLYEVMTAHPPFAGATIEDIFARILMSDPEPPRTLNPAISRDLETICLKALEKDASRRYATAAQMATDLRRWLEGAPIAARPPSTIERVSRGVRRRPAVVVAVAAVLVLAIAGAIVVWRWPRDPAASPPPVADRLPEAMAAIERGRGALEEAVRATYVRPLDVAGMRERLAKAHAAFEQALAAAPRLATAHFLMGRVWELEGWWDRAEASWREALAIDPSLAAARYQLARMRVVEYFLLRCGAESERGRPPTAAVAEEAASELEKSAEDDVQRAVARLLLAQVRDPATFDAVAAPALRELQGRTGAEDLFWVAAMGVPEANRAKLLDAAIQRRPGHAAALFLRASLRARGESKAALADYDQAIAIHPRFFFAYVNRASLREPPEALEDLAKAMELRPDHPVPYNNRGDVHKAQRREREAIADFERAVALDPSYVRAWVNLAEVHADAGDFDAAMKVAERAIAARPGGARLLTVRGRIRMLKGDLAGARADHDAAIDADPRLAEAWNNRGSVRQQQKDYAGAIADLTRAIELLPDGAGAWFNRGVAKHFSGDPAAALADYDKAIELNPGYVNALFKRGVARQDLKDAEGALAAYDRVLQLRPKHYEALYNRAGVKRQKGDRPGALDDYRRALEAAPKDWPYRERTEERIRALERGA